MTRCRSVNNSTCKRVLNLLESGYLKLLEVVAEKITESKCAVNDGGGSDTSRCGIDVEHVDEYDNKER